MINPLTYIKIIGEMIKKNFKVLIRSKSSALIILLGPFLIIFLIGVAFNTTNLHGIRVAIYAEDTSNPVLDQIKTSLKDNDFAITETATEDECINMVKSGGAHICMSFPGSLTKDSLSRQIIFHVDYSKVNLVFTILNVITNEVKDISTDLSVEYTRLLIEQMNRTGAEIEEKSSLVADLSDNAQQMKENLQALSAELNGINVSSKELGLSDTASYISQSQSQIDEFSAITEETTASGLELLDSLDTYIASFKSDLDAQITTVEDFQSKVDTYETLACAFDFSAVEGLSFDPCSDLESIASSLNDTVTEAQSLGSQFDEIQSQLDDVRSQLETAQEEQSTILSTAQSNLDSLQSQLDSSSTKIDEMSDKKDAIASDIDSLVAMLDENIATIDDVQSSIGNISDQLKNGDLEDPEHIVNPILTQIKPILEKKTYLDYTMPALVVLIIMFMSILLSSTIVMTEKGSRAYFRNYITPIPDLSFLISIYLTNIIIVLIQASILLVIAQVAFGVSIFSNIVPIAVAVLIISSIFILLGMCIGYLFVSEETATLASISASSIFLLFSSFLIPIESLSKTIAAVAMYNPFVLAEGVLRQLIIFGNGLSSAGNDLYVMILYVFVLAAVLYVCEAIDKRRFH
ncbi:ABC transporter permease [Candidatus Woesearchaeota archaeon]|nr:ABC transporter permease [Candidatus Woesearchaeota archaeon]